MELLKPMTDSLPTEVSEEQVLRIVKDLCRTLVLCREYDIVRRDIKPQNIFVLPHGNYKLGDFGVAKAIEKTMGGTKTGTYKYMAPEVYNNQPYGAGADIYSLGLVLYWLLNERRLLFLPLLPEKLRAGMDEEARNRRLHGETIPTPAHGTEGLKNTVLKACAFDLKDRYQSTEEMLNDLNALSSKAVTQNAPAREQAPTPPVIVEQEEEKTVGIWPLPTAEPKDNGDETVGV